MKPSVVVVWTLDEPARARLIVATREEEEEIRLDLIERPDLVAEVALAVGELLEVLDRLHEEGEAA